MSDQFKTWDQYAEEAKKAPYPLVISKDETITFEMPSGTALMRIMQGLRNGDLVLILESLAGDAWPRLEELFGGIGHKALPALTEDLMDYFDLYEDVQLVGPGGGKLTRRRPTDIKRMLDQGYRPMGEGPASRS